MEVKFVNTNLIVVAVDMEVILTNKHTFFGTNAITHSQQHGQNYWRSERPIHRKLNGSYSIFDPECPLRWESLLSNLSRNGIFPNRFVRIDPTFQWTLEMRRCKWSYCRYVYDNMNRNKKINKNIWNQNIKKKIILWQGVEDSRLDTNTKLLNGKNIITYASLIALRSFQRPLY